MTFAHARQCLRALEVDMIIALAVKLAPEAYLIVRVRHPQVVVESLICWEEHSVRTHPKVPFTDNGRAIAQGLQDLRYGDLIEGEPAPGARVKDPRIDP